MKHGEKNERDFFCQPNLTFLLLDMQGNSFHQSAGEYRVLSGRVVIFRSICGEQIHILSATKRLNVTRIIYKNAGTRRRTTKQSWTDRSGAIALKNKIDRG